MVAAIIASPIIEGTDHVVSISSNSSRGGEWVSFGMQELSAVTP